MLDGSVLCRMGKEVVMDGAQLRTESTFGEGKARGRTRGLVMKHPARHLVKAGVCRQAIWDELVNALQGLIRERDGQRPKHAKPS